MSQHILSLSYGKDSLACLGAIEKLGWPLDRIIHAEVWATDTIPADLSQMVEFKAKADQIIAARWGIEVEHVRAKLTAQDIMYHVRRSGNRPGQIAGWPMVSKCELQKPLKRQPIERATRGTITYLGIAADEPNRFGSLSHTRRSPLVELGWTEADCRQWCEENGLLSPIYTTATRGGCWFCHNQSVNQLRLLRQNYPDLWALMLKWDADSPVTFHADGHTVHDFERRFQAEDENLIFPNDKKFRWSMLDEELNLRWF